MRCYYIANINYGLFMSLIDSLCAADMIQVQKEAANWKDAVKLGVGCLVGAGKVKWGYYNAILRSAFWHGPYFVLMPGVALPHARPSKHVMDMGFSLITLKTPVNFGMPENDPISVLLSFASPSAIMHTGEALMQAAMVFEEEDRVEKMANAQSADEIRDILSAVDFSELDDL